MCTALHETLQRQPATAVLDTHFGAGLAFLLSWQLADEVRKAAGAQERLDYIAIQSQPWTVAQLEHWHADWPELSAYADRLRAAWPHLLPGAHRLIFDDGRVVLTLIVGDADEALLKLDAGVDLIYAHAQATHFDAARQGWTLHVCRSLARVAWTAAQAMVWGDVDDALDATLRETGFARDPDLSYPQAVAFRYAPQWRRPLTHVAARETPVMRGAATERHALVIGAGLAGTAITERLAARGWRLDLVDRCEAPAQRASGNHGGLFMPALARDDSVLSRLTRAAYLFAIGHWARLGGVTLDGAGLVGETCGVLQLARNDEQENLYARINDDWHFPPGFAQLLSAQESSTLLGMPASGGWYFPEAGWLNPPSVCRRLLAASGPAVAMHFGRDVAQLQYQDGQWQALDAQGTLIAQAPVVILAGGAEAARLSQAAGFPLEAFRGQVTHLPAEDFPSLPVALCGDGYLTRAYAGKVCLGATYDKRDGETLEVANHAENLGRLPVMLPEIGSRYVVPDVADPNLEGRIGFRSVAPDRLPLVGALPDVGVTWSRSNTRLADVPRYPGLYGALGYASRGLIWAPLMAEWLASTLENEPRPLQADLAAALDPARFLWRDGGNVPR